MVIDLAGNAVKKRNWMEAVVSMLEAAKLVPPGEAEYWSRVVGFVSLIAEARNAVEHPKENYRLICLDYRLGVDNQISQPTIELVHPEYKFGPVSATHAMSVLLGSFVVAFEDTLAALCALKVNAEDKKGPKRFVEELPEEGRRNKFVRYGYGVLFPDGRTGRLIASG
jgi:hypothetical protein